MRETQTKPFFYVNRFRERAFMLNSPVSLWKIPLYRVTTPKNLFMGHQNSKKEVFLPESLQHFLGHLVSKKRSIRFREFDIRTPHFSRSYHYIFKAKTSPVRASNTTAKAKFFPAEFNANKHKNFILITLLAPNKSQIVASRLWCQIPILFRF